MNPTKYGRLSPKARSYIIKLTQIILSELPQPNFYYLMLLSSPIEFRTRNSFCLLKSRTAIYVSSK